MHDAPLDDEEFRRWQDDAGQALRAARIQADAGVHNWACFLAEQAALLAVEGLLRGLGVAAWGHDVARLGDGAGEQLGEELWPPGLGDACVRLSRFHIPTRYPDASPSGPAHVHFRPGDAQSAIRDAQVVVSAVTAAWRQLSL